MSRCACCERVLEMRVSGGLERIEELEGGGVMLFTPSVDWSNLSAPTIIPDY